jgi:glycosyltransferase involved in cell wall biosynthesis
LRALHNSVIDVTGRVPDVQPYLAQSTVFVCPLRMGAGLKNKVLEALAAGIPVVATPLSFDGINTEHGRDALVAEVNTMADLVISLLKNPDLQRQLAHNGRRLLEECYSWGHVASEYEALYQSLKS